MLHRFHRIAPAVTLLCALLSSAQAAGPRSSLVDATFIGGAVLISPSAPELGEFPAALQKIATAAGGRCTKSEYVTWDSQPGLESTFKGGLGALGYSYTLVGSNEEGGHYAFFKLSKGGAAIAGIWADTQGTTLLGWCSLGAAQAAAPAKPPAALTPTKPAAPAKPATTPTAQAPVKPAQAPVKVPPPPAKPAPAAAVKPPAPRRGYVSGLVLDTQGRPLAGAEIYIVGTTFTQGQRTDFTVQTKADGSYALRVPDGRYHASASITRELAGVTFKLPLFPDSGSLNTEVDSSEGGNLNFRWKLSGKKPGGGSSYGDYYGGSLRLSYCGLPASAYCDARYNAVTPGAAPGGSTVTVTLTPQGKLLDGSTGRPVSFSFKAAPLSPPGGYPYSDPKGGGRTVLGADWQYQSTELNDIPLGIYTMTASATLPDGRQVPLKLGLNDKDVEYPSVTVKFQADDSYHFLKQLKVNIRD